MVVLVLSSLALLSVPLARSAVDRGRARQAAGFVAGRFHETRIQAIYRTRIVGVVFEFLAGRWVFFVCEDGNGNGLRRVELSVGPDRCLEGPYDLAAIFPGTTIALDPAIPDPNGVTGSADAVRFGRSDLVSFSPTGDCTPGSLYLRSADGVQYAVRLNGVLGRSRVLRFDPGTGHWEAL